jgi:hypothetical protein
LKNQDLKQIIVLTITIKKMKNKIKLLIFPLTLMGFCLLLINSCKDDEPEFNCHEYVKAHSGYEVWAGDTPYYQLDNHFEYFYCIDQFDYELIGSASTTQTFNTGNHKYYVIVAKYNICIDAIQFFDSTYYHFGDYTVIGGQGDDINKFLGPADGISGYLGPINDCPPPIPSGWTTSFPDGYSSSFNGYITDSETILSRGGGLTVYVGSGCQ